MSYAYSVLSAGVEPGTTDIDVAVIESAAFSASIEFDNFGSSYASRERLSERLRYDNLTGRGDAVALQIVHGLDPGDLLFGHLSYEFPITSRGTKLNAYVSAGDFEVGRDLALLGLSGESLAYGIGATHPLKRSRARSITAALGFDSADADFGMNLNICGGVVAQNISEDRIRKLRAGIAVEDRAKGGEARNLLNVYVHQGLGGFLGGSENDAISSRTGADNSFTKFTVDFTRLQKLDDTSYFSIKLSGQHSLDGLFSGEQIAVGGPDSVRGYPQSETLGDSGFIVNAEYCRTLKEAPRNDPDELRKRWLHDLQGVVFIDYGHTDLKNPVAGEGRGVRDLTGIGIGFRANLKHDTKVRTDLGFAIGDGPSVGGRFQPYVKIIKTF